MASFVSENWECIKGCDDFDTSEIDGAHLMSQLLDESQPEDCDDHERLAYVIRSLEAEIEPTVMMDSLDLFMDLELEVEDCSFPSEGQLNGQDCSTPCDDIDYNWMDMEDIKNSYLNPCEYRMEGVIEFGSVSDCYHYASYVHNLEEHTYGSIWQDTNVLLI